MDVHQAHGSGYTALCEAAHHNRLNIVGLLVARGADMEIGSKSGFSAVSVAAYNGRDAVLRGLDSAGANLDKTGFANMGPEYSETPLMRAIAAGHTSTALLLIELGADVRLARTDGKTALHHAAEKGNVSVTAALLAKGAAVNAQTKGKEETPLMLAALRGNAEVVRLLLDAGADKEMWDWRGCTAWVIAKQANHDRELRNLFGANEAEQQEEDRRMEGLSLGELARRWDQRARGRGG